MPELELTNEAGERIYTVEDWGRLGQPQSTDQWVPGRSAYELARAWAGPPRVPADLIALLETNEHTATYRVVRAIAEPRAKFDAYRSPRRHDLVFEAHAKGGTRLVCGVEAKVRDTFKPSVNKAIADVPRTRKVPEKSEMPDRL